MKFQGYIVFVEFSREEVDEIEFASPATEYNEAMPDELKVGDVSSHHLRNAHLFCFFIISYELL